MERAIEPINNLAKVNADKNIGSTRTVNRVLEVLRFTVITGLHLLSFEPLGGRDELILPFYTKWEFLLVEVGYFSKFNENQKNLD